MSNDYWLIQDDYNEHGEVVDFKFIDVVNDETPADDELRRSEVQSMNEFLPRLAEFLKHDYQGE